MDLNQSLMKFQKLEDWLDISSCSDLLDPDTDVKVMIRLQKIWNNAYLRKMVRSIRPCGSFRTREYMEHMYRLMSRSFTVLIGMLPTIEACKSGRCDYHCLHILFLPDPNFQYEIACRHPEVYEFKENIIRADGKYDSRHSETRIQQIIEFTGGDICWNAVPVCLRKRLQETLDKQPVNL